MKEREKKGLRSFSILPADEMSEKTVIIMGQEVKLGDQKLTVLRRLKKTCYIKALPEEDGIQAIPKTDTAGKFWLIKFSKGLVSLCSICRPKTVPGNVNWVGVWNKKGEKAAQKPATAKTPPKDPGRIKEILEALWHLWRKNRGWRFGQLVLNSTPSLQSQKDLFFFSDEDLLGDLQSCLKKLKAP